MLLRAPHQVSVNGQIFEAGDLVEVRDSDAEPLTDQGWELAGPIEASEDEQPIEDEEDGED